MPIHTVRPDVGLRAALHALAPTVLRIRFWRVLSLEAVAGFGGYRPSYGIGTMGAVGSGPVGFIGTELRVFSLDAVFTWALVITLHLSLPAWPTCGACGSS